MVLTNVAAFAVLKVLQNLVSMHKNNCENLQNNYCYFIVFSLQVTSEVS